MHRWKRKSNHLDNQDILFAFMNIASKSNPLKPLKCTLRKNFFQKSDDRTNCTTWKQLPWSRWLKFYDLADLKFQSTLITQMYSRKRDDRTKCTTRSKFHDQGDTIQLTQTPRSWWLIISVHWNHSSVHSDKSDDRTNCST